MFLVHLPGLAPDASWGTDGGEQFRPFLPWFESAGSGWDDDMFLSWHLASRGQSGYRTGLEVDVGYVFHSIFNSGAFQ